MRIRQPSPATALAATALFIALGGTSYAAITITGAQVKNGSLTSADVKDKSLKAADFAPGAVPTGTKGDAGAAGAKGDPGAPGPRGAAGPAGADAYVTRGTVGPRLVGALAPGGCFNINTEATATASSVVQVTAINPPAYTVLEPFIESGLVRARVCNVGTATVAQFSLTFNYTVG